MLYRENSDHILDIMKDCLESNLNLLLLLIKIVFDKGGN